MSRPTCQTCRFWEPNADREGSGFCLRFPPVGAEPDVYAKSWCGEHQPAAPAEPTNDSLPAGARRVRTPAPARPELDAMVARVIGNAVPPPLARAVAAQLVRAMGIKPTRPRKVLALGDDSLLFMTVSEAADVLGVEAPSQRRDRHSGAKKRKQHETEAARLASLGALSNG